MKKSALVILLFILSSGKAQDIRKHTWINTFEISPTFTNNYKSFPVETNFSGKMKSNHGLFNGSVGFSFVRQGKNKLDFETGISLGRRGYSYFSEVSYYNWDGYSTYQVVLRNWYREFEHFFRVPIGINYNLPLSKGELFFKTGFALDLTLFRESNVLESETTEFAYGDLGTGTKKRTNEFSPGIGLYLKFGYSFRVGQKYSLAVSSFFSHDLSQFTDITYSTGLTIGLKKSFTVERLSDKPPKSERNKEAMNSVYVEGLGTGIIWSVNYERRLYAGNWFDFDARVGFGHPPRLSVLSWVFPASLSASFGNTVNKFEFLCGTSMGILGGELNAESVNTHIGYRLDSNNLIFFRAALGGMYFLQGGGFIPDAAIALGRRF